MLASAGPWVRVLGLGPLKKKKFVIKFCLSIYFWLCWVFVAAWAFLQLQKAGAALWLRCSGFSCGAGSRAPGLGGRGSHALEHRLSSGGAGLAPRHVGPLRQGRTAASRALAGRFLTTEPPGKSWARSQCGWACGRAVVVGVPSWQGLRHLSLEFLAPARLIGFVVFCFYSCSSQQAHHCSWCPWVLWPFSLLTEVNWSRAFCVPVVALSVAGSS